MGGGGGGSGAVEKPPPHLKYHISAICLPATKNLITT